MDESVQQKPGYWAVLPADVRYDPDLPPMARLLYAEISSLTDKEGFCYASNAYFLRVFEIAERTLQRHLRVLEEHGYLRIEDGDGGQGRRKIYTGINPLNGNPAKNDGVTPSKLSPNPVKNVTHIKTENKIEEHPPKAPQGAGGKNRRRKKASVDWEPEIFERFWQAYPRHEDKAAARFEWDELRPDRKLMEEMSAVLSRQRKSEEWRRGVGIPYACRWLRDRRFEDGPAEDLSAHGGRSWSPAGADEWLA